MLPGDARSSAAVLLVEKLDILSVKIIRLSMIASGPGDVSQNDRRDIGKFCGFSSVSIQTWYQSQSNIYFSPENSVPKGFSLYTSL